MKNRTVIGIVCILLAMVLSFVVVPKIAEHTAEKAAARVTATQTKGESNG